VIYEKFARARSEGTRGEKIARELLSGALARVMNRPLFLAALKKGAPPSTRESFEKARFARCVVAHKSPMPQAAESVLQGVVTISSDRALGTGVILSESGLVITAGHVVDDPGPYRIRLRSGEQVEGKVLRINSKFDVAVLQAARAERWPCIPTRLAPARVGEELHAVGTPLGDELAASLTRGIVSGFRTADGVPLVQTDASINPGNSGGPLLDAEGAVLGVVTHKLTGAAVEGIGFAVPAGVALDALALEPADTTDPHLLTPVQSANPSSGKVVDETDAPVDLGETVQRLRPLPPGLAQLRIYSFVVGASGLGMVFSSWLAYSSSKETMDHDRFRSNRTWNDIGWVALAAGATGVTLSYVLPAARPKNRERDTALQLEVRGPSVTLTGSF
jgi:hypothetical protein